MPELKGKTINKSKVIARLAKRYPHNVRNGVEKAGYYMEGQIKKLLSGPSHTRFPGNPNPYPGVLSNTLRSSVTTDVQPGGMSVEVGPSVGYGRFLEFGTRRWRGGVQYPFMNPAFKMHGGRAVELIHREIMRGV